VSDAAGYLEQEGAGNCTPMFDDSDTGFVSGRFGCMSTDKAERLLLWEPTPTRMWLRQTVGWWWSKNKAAIEKVAKKVQAAANEAAKASEEAKQEAAAWQKASDDLAAVCKSLEDRTVAKRATAERNLAEAQKLKEAQMEEQLALAAKKCADEQAAWNGALEEAAAVRQAASKAAMTNLASMRGVEQKMALVVNDTLPDLKGVEVADGAKETSPKPSWVTKAESLAAKYM